jgi:hypothetical protein
MSPQARRAAGRTARPTIPSDDLSVCALSNISAETCALWQCSYTDDVASCPVLRSSPFAAGALHVHLVRDSRR